MNKLMGQYNNTITCERKKNVLLGVTGISSSQLASMFTEKAAFLQKFDQALFGKDFTDHLTENLKARTQSIEAICKYVNTFCFKRKKSCQISLPVMINMKELTYVHPILKKKFSKQTISKCAQTRSIKEFLLAWKLLALSDIKSYRF